MSEERTPENQRQEHGLLRAQRKAIFRTIYTFVYSIFLISGATLQLIVWIITKTAPWYLDAGMIVVDILGIVGLVTSGKKLLISSINIVKRRRIPVAPEEEHRRE